MSGPEQVQQTEQAYSTTSCASEQHVGHRQFERLGGLEVDDQFYFH
jgi:hypothetical protein